MTQGITQEGIEAILAHKLHEALLKHCITDMPITDPSRANHVVLGKPTSERRDESVISIMMQNPLGPSKDSERLVQGIPFDESVRPYIFPPESIKGMVTETGVGVVWVAIREMKDYSQAMGIISSTVERVKVVINRAEGLVPLYDDFGNFLFKLETFRAAGYETGGRNVAINHRFIDFRGLVARTNCRDGKTGRQ